MKVTILGEEFTLLPQKALWWKSKKILLVADMHLGKVNHFRKAGIPVPVKANKQNWETLVELVQRMKPERLVCIGDLFHSHYNHDWESVRQFTGNFSELSFELVTGNHDILSDHQYMRSRVRVHKDQLMMERFLFNHFPVEEESGFYAVSGHIHPGVRLSGKGRQALTLPCFYFGKNQAYLPAFGMFTGIKRIKPGKDDQVFIIAEDTVIKM